MSHDHDHSHSHGHHHHVPKSINTAFKLGIVLNLSFVLVEVAVGFWKHSLALLTDAGHNFSDVVSLLFVLIAHRLSQMKPTQNFTYGYSKSTVLVALTNAILLLVAIGAIGWEAVSRISQPHPVEGGVISIVAFAGLIINAATALLFFRDREKDLNVKGAYLHMAADAAVSTGVAVAGIVIIYTHWYWLDSVISLVIILVIIFSTWGLLRDSVRLSLDGVPMNIDPEKVRVYFNQLKDISGFHDLHIWALSTTEAALTVHVISDATDTDALIVKIKHNLHHDFEIEHTTIQIERPGKALDCHQMC